MKNVKKDDRLQWRVNTAGLLKEITGNKETWILKRPIQIFANLLAQVADRVIELNDPELNKLMGRLSLYGIADPFDDGYDKVGAEELIANGKLSQETIKRIKGK